MVKKILIISLIFISLAINSFAIPEEVAERFIGKEVYVYFLIPFGATFWETRTQGYISEISYENSKYYIILKINPTEIYKLNISKIVKIEEVK